MWFYMLNFNNHFFNYTNYFIDCRSDEILWSEFYVPSNNFQALYLIWFFQLACHNYNLELINWIILESLKTNKSYADIKNFTYWFYNKLHFCDDLNLKVMLEINHFRTIKDFVKEINLFETKNEDHFKQECKLIFLEKILDIALYDIQKNYKEIFFLYRLIKNKMSDNIKSNILYFYIINPNSKNINIINMFKKVVNNTSNKCKINTLLDLYKYNQKNIYHYTLEQLVKLVDCNIYVLHKDKKLDQFIKCAISNDDIFTLEYLSKIFYEEIILEKKYKYYFIEWILKKFKKNIDSWQKQKGFTYLCMNGHLKIAYIFDRYIDDDEIPEIMVSILENGNLNVLKIKWLKKLSNIYTNCDFYQCPFLYALHYSNIDVAFLIKKYTNLSICYDDVLISLCSDFGEYPKKINNNSRCHHEQDILKKRLRIIKWVIKSCIDYDFDFSCLYKCWKIPSIILRKIFNFSDSTIKLYKAILHSSFSEVEKAIKEGADIYVLNNFLFLTSCKIYNERIQYPPIIFENASKIINYFCLLDSKFYSYEIDEYGTIEFGKHEIVKNARNF